MAIERVAAAAPAGANTPSSGCCERAHERDRRAAEQHAVEIGASRSAQRLPVEERRQDLGVLRHGTPSCHVNRAGLETAGVRRREQIDDADRVVACHRVAERVGQRVADSPRPRRNAGDDRDQRAEREDADEEGEAAAARRVERDPGAT
jgi:hypothetical protein